jgi:hypothetical protein
LINEGRVGRENAYGEVIRPGLHEAGKRPPALRTELKFRRVKNDELNSNVSDLGV